VNSPFSFTAAVRGLAPVNVKRDVGRGLPLIGEHTDARRAKRLQRHDRVDHFAFERHRAFCGAVEPTHRIGRLQVEAARRHTLESERAVVSGRRLQLRRDRPATSEIDGGAGNRRHAIRADNDARHGSPRTWTTVTSTVSPSTINSPMARPMRPVAGIVRFDAE
jgi:hypothetical protein